MAGPAIVIRLDLEELAPKVLLDALNEGEEHRIVDWVGSQHELAAIVQRAIDAGEEARAA